MNKRLSKKVLKRKNLQKGYIYADGNNGGDIIEIEEKGNGLIRISSASCCVYDLNAIVPTEFITAIINNKMLEHNGDINSVIDSFAWNAEYKDKLKSKVRKLKWYER
jgi:hypothetical protein